MTPPIPACMPSQSEQTLTERYPVCHAREPVCSEPVPILVEDHAEQRSHIVMRQLCTEELHRIPNLNLFRSHHILRRGQNASSAGSQHGVSAPPQNPHQNHPHSNCGSQARPAAASKLPPPSLWSRILSLWNSLRS